MDDTAIKSDGPDLDASLRDTASPLSDPASPSSDLTTDPLLPNMRTFIFDIDGATTRDIAERHNRLVRYVFSREVVRERDARAESLAIAKRFEEVVEVDDESAVNKSFGRAAAAVLSDMMA